VATKFRAAVVFDFDGTVYRGNDPYYYYAREISQALPAAERESYLAAMEAYLCQESSTEASDAWEAAVVLAGGPGGASAAYADAFAATRRYMTTLECQLEIPEGLGDLLGELRDQVRLVLASNTPARFVYPLLAHLEVLDWFDEISCQSEKPDRFAARLEGVAATLEIPLDHVMSVGDHFVNDIAPALDLGCATAYVDTYGVGPDRVGPDRVAALHAATVEELLDPLRLWAKEKEQG
jgi:FMN phosphatase YigB (HAD superfamily)